MTFDLGVRKEKEFVKHSGRRGIKDRRVMVDEGVNTGKAWKTKTCLWTRRSLASLGKNEGTGNWKRIEAPQHL